MDALNPLQQQVVDELFKCDPPPEAEGDEIERLRTGLQRGTAEAAGLVPPGDDGLFVSKSTLDALDCDGRFLDRLDGEFSWNAQMVRGQLAHAGIAVDIAGGRRHDPAALIAFAWEEFVASGRAAAGYLATMDGVQADALRAQAQHLVVEFREQFPPLDARWHPRVEPALRVTLHDGRITLLGKPDLLLGRATRDRRRMLLVDLKTGHRNALRHRADMRFYALLAALKYGVAPYRVATFYLDEGAWDAEDVAGHVLEAAALTVAEKVRRAAALTHARPPDEGLRLLPGPACAWCDRLAHCPAAAWDAAGAA